MDGEPGQQEELEWNVAKERVKKIAQILSKLRDSYEHARHGRQRKHVRAYYTYLNSLYMELSIYMDDEPGWLYRTEDLRELFQQADTIDDLEALLREDAQTIGERLAALEKTLSRKNSDRIPLRTFQKMEKIDRELNERRRQMNLDIPTVRQYAEGEELLH